MRYIKAHEEYATSPLTISPNHSGWPHPILKRLLDGKEVGNDTFCIHHDNSLEYFADYDAWDEGSDYLLEKIKHDKQFIIDVYEGNKRIAKEAIPFVKEFEQKDITSLDNNELADFLEKSYELGSDFSAYGFIPVFSDHLFHKFTHELKSIVKTSKGKEQVDMTDPEMVHLLSTQVEMIPSRIARIELLKLALGTPEDQDINDYYDNWFWVDFGQLGPRKTLDDIHAAIKKLSADKERTQEELEVLTTSIEKTKDEQRELETTLHFTDEQKHVFSVAIQFMYLKGLRMEVLFSIYAGWNKVLEEMAKRFHVDIGLLYNASIQELCAWLHETEKIDEEVLKERKKYCVWIAKTENTQEILTGDKAKEFLQNISYKEDDNLEDVLVIHGTVASPGYAQGTVKIVNRVEEINKIEEGDIMVAVATHPALLPAMKRAVAFVTDSGGITSHAAIVAREMKKPCIIGARVATKVLKDGDRIELDTKKGDIRKITE